MTNTSVIHIGSEQKMPMLLIIMFLIVTMLLLAWLLMTVSMLHITFKETKTEVRILQMHVQDQNAILIRSGLLLPGDLTTGPTHPDKLGAKQ